ncbi:MAG: hypothetical protein WD266_04160 [Balneolales bacterium]
MKRDEPFRNIQLPARFYLGLLLLVWAMASACVRTNQTAIAEAELQATGPVAWDVTIPEGYFHLTHRAGASGADHLARVRLTIINLPSSEEGNRYTLIGGTGYHFAEPDRVTGPDPAGGIAFEAQYTRMVRAGRIEFEVYFDPTPIREEDVACFPGPELALSVIREGTGSRVLYGSNNKDHWAIAGVGKGNAAEIVIDMAWAEYTWYHEL